MSLKYIPRVTASTRADADVGGIAAPSVREVDSLQDLYREGLKLAEEEQKILNDDPNGTVQNLSLLTALRNASENEPPRTSTNLKSRNTKRKFEADGVADSPGPSPSAASSVGHARLKGTSGRSGSVPFTPREAKEASAKMEEGLTGGLDGAKGTAAEKAGLLVKKAEVAYKQNKQKGAEGDWIQCIIISVSGEGKNKR